MKDTNYQPVDNRFPSLRENSFEVDSLTNNERHHIAHNNGSPDSETIKKQQHHDYLSR